MKPADNATRTAFIEQMKQGQVSRLEITNALHKLNPREQAIFLMGFRDGVGSVISSTDSRQGNGAQFRITDVQGDYLPFYDNDAPEGGGITPEEMNTHPGLIVAIFPHPES